ncbi:MAG: matrixin family metalloprotease [Candidatus Pacearchaeota archaeon]|jgi:predicted Zn-dependent protease
METKKILPILFVLLILSYAFVFQEDIIRAYKSILNKIDPCSTPIAYSVGQFDTEFGISEEVFKSAIKEAEDIWEKASSRDLFEYSSEGEMKVSLIYDYRQESTSEISELDDSLSKSYNYYLLLKSQYESLVIQYNKAGQELNSLIVSYNQKLAAYESKVRAWNKKRGTEQEYNQLNQEKQELESLSATIKTKQNDVNSMALSINQLATNLNTLANNLNLNIADYNDAVQSAEPEFEQGNYISGIDSREINIYQFESREKLVRVLAHELGHALGIDHLNNSEDIMYPYNIGASKAITEADLVELNKACPE